MSTQIQVSERTRDELRALKVGGETYDDLLRRMIIEDEGGVEDEDGLEATA